MEKRIKWKMNFGDTVYWPGETVLLFTEAFAKVGKRYFGALGSASL